MFEEQVKRPMRELVEALNARAEPFAPEYVTDPEKAIYRIYRDTRFSKDKTPYKDHIAASFSVAGHRSAQARRLLPAGLAQGGSGGRRGLHAGAGGAARDSPAYRREPPEVRKILAAPARAAVCWESCRAIN